MCQTQGQRHPCKSDTRPRQRANAQLCQNTQSATVQLTPIKGTAIRHATERRRFLLRFYTYTINRGLTLLTKYPTCRSQRNSPMCDANDPSMKNMREHMPANSLEQLLDFVVAKEKTIS